MFRDLYLLELKIEDFSGLLVESSGVWVNRLAKLIKYGEDVISHSS